MKNYRKYITLLCCCLSLSTMSCKSKNTAGAAMPVAEDKGTQMQAVSTNEQKINTFFEAFRQAVKQNNMAQLENMLYFPLQTTTKWANEDLKNMDVDKNAGKVSRQEFSQYYKDIFTADVQRVLPKAGEEDLSGISENTPEDYYRTLMKETDPHTKMYEVYMQFPEQNTNAETYFAFVFGMVKGEYKVISYHAKWPVKD